jgi:hypothetical protein
MRDLVLGTIRDQPDIEIVGETEDEGEITEMVERMRPDYLIVGLDEPEAVPALCGFLLGRYPGMKIPPWARSTTAASFTGPSSIFVASGWRPRNKGC